MKNRRLKSNCSCWDRLKGIVFTKKISPYECNYFQKNVNETTYKYLIYLVRMNYGYSERILTSRTSSKIFTPSKSRDTINSALKCVKITPYSSGIDRI